MISNDSALLIIDMQNDYFPGGNMELEGIDKAVVNVETLLELFRKNNKPVYHIQHLSPYEGATFFKPGTDGVKIYKTLIPLDSEKVINKYLPNSFRGTELEKELKLHGIKNLVICGAMSHMCIDATVRAAFDLEFSLIVASDACATRNLQFENNKIPAQDVHNSFMAALNGIYAQVIKTYKIIENNFKPG